MIQSEPDPSAVRVVDPGPLCAKQQDFTVPCLVLTCRVKVRTVGKVADLEAAYRCARLCITLQCSKAIKYYISHRTSRAGEPHRKEAPWTANPRSPRPAPPMTVTGGCPRSPRTGWMTRNGPGS